MKRWILVPKRKLNNIASFLDPIENKAYLAVGSMKTLMLSVSLFNAGDDAYETALHIKKLPTHGLYFIKILDQVNIKHILVIDVKQMTH